MKKTHKIDLKMKATIVFGSQGIKKYIFILSYQIKAQYEPRENNILTDYGLRT